MGAGGGYGVQTTPVASGGASICSLLVCALNQSINNAKIVV
jgi:hypothetical protein